MQHMFLGRARMKTRMKGELRMQSRGSLMSAGLERSRWRWRENGHSGGRRELYQRMKKRRAEPIRRLTKDQ